MKRLAPPPTHWADAEFATDLITWQAKHGRHQLPWQQSRDPYRVWLSEIMLQQTQVATVIPYYQRFLEHFPDLQALADAPVTEVMALWSGLGYYSRARNLHRCAQVLVQQYGGSFPREVEVLASLPGIGPSTAAAIAAFSFGARAAILDGNVKRVLCRVFGIEGFPGQAQIEQQLWRLASDLLPQQGIESYTQGLMDLGATLCTRNRPRCEACPMQGRCVAKASARIAELPTRKPAKIRPERFLRMLVVLYEGEVLLEQRADSGIWGGLMSLPELPWKGVTAEIGDASTESEDVGRVSAALIDLGVVKSISPLPDFVHGFTHYKLHVRPLRVELAQRFMLAGQSAYHWIASAQLQAHALPAPVRKLLSAELLPPALLTRL